MNMSFKPYYKWIIFNIANTVDIAHAILVLNLIING